MLCNILLNIGRLGCILILLRSLFYNIGIATENPCILYMYDGLIIVILMLEVVYMI